MDITPINCQPRFGSINQTNRQNKNISFNATAKEYKSAVKYLNKERRTAVKSSIGHSFAMLKGSIINRYPWKIIKRRLLNFNPKSFVFSNTDTAGQLNMYGIKTLDMDKLEGIQYGIDVFDNLTMREIVFLLYRVTNLSALRGCNNKCEHCMHDAKSADKNQLSTMPYEDFIEITDGYNKLNNRINNVLKNNKSESLVGKYSNDIVTQFAAEMTAFFFDSDGMDIILKDKSGNEHDFIDLAEAFHNSTGKKLFFDTAGWNPKNKKLQARAEKYAEYFSKTDSKNKIEQVNLSVNTFNPLYSKSYKLGYRSGEDNDMTNPNIKMGKQFYERYIEMLANVLVTFKDANNLYLLISYASRWDKNMEGYYFADLKKIFGDSEKRCIELLQEKYSGQELDSSIRKIKDLIADEISVIENSSGERKKAAHKGRYEDLYNKRNPQNQVSDYQYTQVIPDINSMSPKEFELFLKEYSAVVDANGEIYYYHTDNFLSLRKLGKSLKISSNGKNTPVISILETRT